MRILIGGEDGLALRIVESLMAEHEVVLIAPEEGRGTTIENLDAQIYFGTCTSGPTLLEAGVDQADLFIACTPVDERNLLACAEAKQMGARRTICFLRRLDVQADEAEAGQLAKSIGIDEVILPGERLAREILRIVLVPDALDVEVFAGGAVELIKRAIPEHALITQSPVMQLGIPKGVVLVQAKRDGKRFIPSGETHFKAEDQVTVMGTHKGLNRFTKRYLQKQRLQFSRHAATIVGGGVVGFQIADGLLRNNWSVRIIETDSERARYLADELKGATVLSGDGTDLQLLQEEAIADDPVLIAVTSNDEKNLLVSLLARQLGVPRIITRADKTDHEKLFLSVGVDVVRSTRGAAIAAIRKEANVGVRDVQSEFEHGEVKVLRLRVPANMPEVELRNLNAPVFAIVGAILRGRKASIPSGKDILKGGDEVLVFCSAKDEGATRTFFEDYIAGKRADSKEATKS